MKKLQPVVQDYGLQAVLIIVGGLFMLVGNHIHPYGFLWFLGGAFLVFWGFVATFVYYVAEDEEET